MEDTASATRDRMTGKTENQEVDQRLLMSGKPLHRFVQKEPKSLGIVIVVFGCAELLMGFHLAKEVVTTSYVLYIPFWQGLLFVVCGNLSIYTELYPSKKMVTVCLAMYVVSFFGIIVSVGYRIHCLTEQTFLIWRAHWRDEAMREERLHRAEQLFSVECLLLTSSLAVSVLLIFLSSIARLALRSTRTQVIVQCVPPPVSDTTSN